MANEDYTNEEIEQAITNVAVQITSGMSVATDDMWILIHELKLHDELNTRCKEIFYKSTCTDKICICGKCHADVK